MMLAAGLGTEVEIEAEGADEAQALDAIVALINDRFGEAQ
jgi:phosphocarrier protein